MDKSLSDAERAGMRAAERGWAFSANPYAQWVGPTSNEAWAWELGWKLARHMKRFEK